MLPGTGSGDPRGGSDAYERRYEAYRARAPVVEKWIAVRHAPRLSNRRAARQYRGFAPPAEAATTVTTYTVPGAAKIALTSDGTAYVSGYTNESVYRTTDGGTVTADFVPRTPFTRRPRATAGRAASSSAQRRTCW